jgi:predicted dehydrogenase
VKHLLICGLGSIGRRHLRIFRTLGVQRIDAYRTGNATLPDSGQPAPDKVFRDLNAALEEGPEAVIVANPTALHVSTAFASTRAGAHVLIEKPVSHTVDGCYELELEARQRRKVVAVAQNLRHHASLARTKQLVVSGELGRPITARLHFGTYLPDWHPWEDYRNGYAARLDLGGGAALTNVHEIDAALWLFGDAVDARGFASPLHTLGTEVAESCSMVVLHESGCVTSVTLSLAQKPGSRSLEIAFEGGNVSANLLTSRMTVARATGEVQEFGCDDAYDWDSTYVSQARGFMDALEGGADYVTLREGVKALELALVSSRGTHGS